MRDPAVGNWLLDGSPSKPLLSHQTSPPLLLQNIPTGQPTLRLATMTPEHHKCPDRATDLFARLLLSIAFVSTFFKEEDDFGFVSTSLSLFIFSLLLTRLWTFIVRFINLIWSAGYGLGVRSNTLRNHWSSGGLGAFQYTLATFTNTATARYGPLLPLYMSQDSSAAGSGFFGTSQPSLRVRKPSRYSRR